MPIASAVLIDAEHAAFLQSAVSINIASCGADLQPNAVRALGCRIAADRRRITLFVSRQHAAPVLADIAVNGRIAAVFSLPSTHRTMQFKGGDARVEMLTAGDLDRVVRYRAAFTAELTGLGYDPVLMRAFLACPDEDIVAIGFSPGAAFTQTPGPRAGAPLGTAP